jgi:hypothetical protein
MTKNNNINKDNLHKKYNYDNPKYKKFGIKPYIYQIISN